MATGKEIKRLRTNDNRSAADVARLIGVDAERLRKWEQRDADPKDTGDILKIESFFGTNLSKLDKIEHFSFSEFGQKENAIRPYSTLVNEPNLLSEKGGDYIATRRAQKNRKEHYYAPFLPVLAQAGYTKTYDQMQFLETLDEYAIPPGINPAGARWMYFEVDGDSMEPELRSGDHVLASMVTPTDWPDLRNFYVYVVVTESQVMIKRVAWYPHAENKWVLVSDNEDAHPQVLLNVEDVKELWKLRRIIKGRIPPPKMFEIKV